MNERPQHSPATVGTTKVFEDRVTPNTFKFQQQSLSPYRKSNNSVSPSGARVAFEDPANEVEETIQGTIDGAMPEN